MLSVNKKFAPHRAYKKLKIGKKHFVESVLIFVLFELLITLLFRKFTYILNNLTISILRLQDAQIVNTRFLGLFALDSFAKFPTPTQSLTIFLVSSLAMLVLSLLSISLFKFYLIYVDFILLVSSFFFLLFPERFPYNFEELSSMLIYIEVSILFLVPLITCATTIFFPATITEKFLYVFLTLIYSFILNTVRYIAFIYTIKTFTYIFVPLFFFAFGVLLDVIYIVWAFSVFTYHKAKTIRKEELEWT